MKLFENKQDKYDEIFGEPTTEVVSIYGVLDYLDEVIKLTEENIFEEDLTESNNSHYDFEIERIVMTRQFEEAVKQLYKKHKSNVINELKDTIIKLGNYEIGKEKKNHPLHNLLGHVDLHLQSGDLILLYKYISPKVVQITVTEDSIKQILKLQDIIDHDELKRYDRKKLKAKTKDFDIDMLNK